MVDMKDLKSFEQKRSCGFDSHLWYVNGGVAQLARASALHAEGHRFDSCHLHNCNDSETNDGTDAKNEMETWACPDTNRTAITKLICRCGGINNGY